jgi:thiol:disulfide interchange protein
LRSIAALIAALTAMASAALAAPAPHIGLAAYSDLTPPLPAPFDSKADARTQIAQAQARAKETGKLVLVDLGANWCAECRLLCALMERPDFAPFIQAHFEVVRVDVGRLNRNLDIPERYGVKSLPSVPAFLVLDKSGRLLNKAQAPYLLNAKVERPQVFADWLAGWTERQDP